MRLTMASCLHAGLLVVFGLMSGGVASAQERSRTMDTNPQTKQLLQRIEADADAFEDKFEVALDRSDVNGNALEDRLNRMADTVEDAVDDMSENYNEKDPQRFINKLEDSLIAAAGLNRFMLRGDMTSATEDWAKLRDDLNQVAKIYHRPVLPNMTVAKLVPVTGEMISKPEVTLLMERIESASDRFEEKFDKSVQHSTANITEREDMFRFWAESLEDATDEMMENFKEKDPKEFSEELERTFVIAETVNRIVLRSDLFKETELQWNELRENLNKAAVIFGHPVLPNVVVSVQASSR